MAEAAAPSNETAIRSADTYRFDCRSDFRVPEDVRRRFRPGNAVPEYVEPGHEEAHRQSDEDDEQDDFVTSEIRLKNGVFTFSFVAFTAERAFLPTEILLGRAPAARQMLAR